MTQPSLLASFDTSLIDLRDCSSFSTTESMPSENPAPIDNSATPAAMASSDLPSVRARELSIVDVQLQLVPPTKAELKDIIDLLATSLSTNDTKSWKWIGYVKQSPDPGFQKLVKSSFSEQTSVMHAGIPDTEHPEFTQSFEGAVYDAIFGFIHRSFPPEDFFADFVDDLLVQNGIACLTLEETLEQSDAPVCSVQSVIDFVADTGYGDYQVIQSQRKPLRSEGQPGQSGQERDPEYRCIGIMVKRVDG